MVLLQHIVLVKRKWEVFYAAIETNPICMHTSAQPQPTWERVADARYTGTRGYIFGFSKAAT